MNNLPTTGYIFVSSPYSHADKAVETERFERVMEFVAALSLAGFHAYSPITHFHPVAVRHAMPTDFEFWGGVCRTMIDSCSALVIAVMPGWGESVGIRGEVEHAHAISKPVYMMEMVDGLVKTTLIVPPTNDV